LLIATIIIIGYGARIYQNNAARPIKIGRTGALPQDVRCVHGVWFWLEHDKKGPIRLVRADADGIRTILTGNLDHGYSLDDTHLAWVSHDGDLWNIMLAENDGKTPHSIAASKEEAFGLTLSGGRAYWLRRTAPPVANGDPFPPLLPEIEVCSVGLEGGSVMTAGRLRESEDGQVLGTHDGMIYVAIYRRLQPGNLLIYRISPNDSAAVRVAGASGHPSALLTRDGSLYWLSASSEELSGYCLNRLTPNGHFDALSDWLPPNGVLYETYNGVAYGEAQSRPAIWPSGPRDVFPTQLPVAEGYFAIAAGDHEALLTDAAGLYSTPTLYRMPLP
jgi:hypothetical protein